jgi:hypothetical protein
MSDARWCIRWFGVGIACFGCLGKVMCDFKVSFQRGAADLPYRGPPAHVMSAKRGLIQCPEKGMSSII